MTIKKLKSLLLEDIAESRRLIAENETQSIDEEQAYIDGMLHAIFYTELK